MGREGTGRGGKEGEGEGKGTWMEGERDGRGGEGREGGCAVLTFPLKNPVTLAYRLFNKFSEAPATRKHAQKAILRPDLNCSLLILLSFSSDRKSLHTVGVNEPNGGARTETRNGTQKCRVHVGLPTKGFTRSITQLAYYKHAQFCCRVNK